MDQKLIVSSSPHIGAKTKTRNIMIDVIIALIPALIASVVIFGPRVIIVTLATIAACVLAEFICRKAVSYTHLGPKVKIFSEIETTCNKNFDDKKKLFG